MIWTKQSDVKARRNGHWMPDQLNSEYTYTCSTCTYCSLSLLIITISLLQGQVSFVVPFVT